jgi:hypothetical protein
MKIEAWHALTHALIVPYNDIYCIKCVNPCIVGVIPCINVYDAHQVGVIPCIECLIHALKCKKKQI